MSSPAWFGEMGQSILLSIVAGECDGYLLGAMKNTLPRCNFYRKSPHEASRGFDILEPCALEGFGYEDRTTVERPRKVHVSPLVEASHDRVAARA